MVSLGILQDLSGMLMSSIAKYHVKVGNNKGKIKRSKQGDALASSENGWKRENNAHISQYECL